MALRCITKQCREWYADREYLAPFVYVYGGLSLCRVHVDIACQVSKNEPLTYVALLIAINNATS